MVKRQSNVPHATPLELLRDEGGATAVEYALIIAAIAAVIIVVVFSVGTKVLALFETANVDWE